jgi:hypothetical protein
VSRRRPGADSIGPQSVPFQAAYAQGFCGNPALRNPLSHRRSSSTNMVLPRVRWLPLQRKQLRKRVFLRASLPRMLEGLRQMTHVNIIGPLLSLFLVLLTTACPQYGSSASGVTTVPPRMAYAPPKLVLFGGEDHKAYLGCLNCSEYATDSVFNAFGSAGNRYSTESIWNRYGEFGSPYSTYSVCNAYATDPPVIVDHEGNYYGRLTLNQYHAEIASGRQYIPWLQQAVCQ